VPGGDGQTDIGLALVNDFFVLPSVTLTTLFEYTSQLQDHFEGRVPYREDSSLGDQHSDYERKISRNLGDMWQGQFGVNWRAWKGLQAMGAYTFQYKNRDEYQGKEFAKERYTWMSVNTQQKMHSMQLGLAYSTLDHFRNKEFPAPLIVSVNHTEILAGKNVAKNGLTSFDVSMFF
jgi:hypothetical protein